MKETALKSILAGALAALAAYFQLLLIPIAVLFTVMVFDYFSGMAAAWIKKKLSSRIGIIGIVKKVCYLLVVTVGMVVDYVIQAVGAQLGLDLSGYFIFGLLVIIWLILNEFISILENLSEIGVPLPEFMTKIVNKLKNQTETRGGSLTQALSSGSADNSEAAIYKTALTALGIELEDISTTALEALATQRLKIPLSGTEVKGEVITLIKAVLDKGA